MEEMCEQTGKKREKSQQRKTVKQIGHCARDEEEKDETRSDRSRLRVLYISEEHLHSQYHRIALGQKRPGLPFLLTRRPQKPWLKPPPPTHYILIFSLRTATVTKEAEVAHQDNKKEGDDVSEKMLMLIDTRQREDVEKQEREEERRRGEGG